jgi:hypothetical protein
MQEDEPSAFVAYDRFEQKMLELLESGEFAPDNEDTLLAAFRVRWWARDELGWLVDCHRLWAPFAASLSQVAVMARVCVLHTVLCSLCVYLRRSTRIGKGTWTRITCPSCCVGTLGRPSETRSLWVC